MKDLVAPPATLEQIRRHLVGLRMPRALEILEDTVRQLEQGSISPLEAVGALLAEELALREGRRIRAALQVARLTAPKTLAEFDFTFQPSLDRNRILTLAQLDFVRRRETVHFLGPPGTGKSHLAVALGVEAIKAGYSVYFATLADIVASLTKPSARASCRSASGSIAALPSCWSMRSAISRSSRAVATCSFNWSTPATSAAA